MSVSQSEHEGLGAGDAVSVAAFAADLRVYASKLTTNFASLTVAQPEDQLKGPVGDLIAAAGAIAGVEVVARTETKIDGVTGRPDLGVDANGLPVGNAELKAPGKGATPAKFSDKRSRDQFERFSKLPNLVYTDGREWSLFRNGEQVGELFRLSFDPTKDGPGAVTDDDAAKLLGFLGVFLRWEPVVPSTPRALAALLAPLTRLLRDEVLADVKNKGVMAKLAGEWRATLFPDADDATFADGYAQTFTYALLLSRLEGATPPLTAETAANELDDDHALLAQALRLLGQPGTREAIGLPVGLLERVVGAVDAAKLGSGKKDPWLYFYEDFLAAYDPVQRNNRGVYYTPFEVVGAQVRLCHHILTERFGLADGFADPNVVVLDPAVGTGTYLLTVASEALDEAVERNGPGVRGQVATRLVNNLTAFEILVGPYAVSHLRLSRTLTDAGAQMPETGVRVYLSDTLASPTHEGFAQQVTLFQTRLAEEQEAASRVKAADTQVTVVIGNPPYDRDESQKKKGDRRKGGMVRYAEDGKSPGLIRDFIEPLSKSARQDVKTIYNDYTYFWRWAIWKACEQHTDPACVSFITASSFLTGRGFGGMREMMRREFDELWFIDLGGDGRGARKDENVFSNVLTPVVITVAVRLPDVDAEERRSTAARVFYRYIGGTQQEKLDALTGMSDLTEGDEWQQPDAGWQASFIPGFGGDFSDWPALEDLLPWRDTGSHIFRAWPIGEDTGVLGKRWATLMSASAADRPALLKESRDRKANKTYADIFGGPRLAPVETLPDDTPMPEPQRYSFRTFDREWVLADNRVADYLRPQLWRVASDKQLYLHTLVEKPMSTGPAVVVHPYVPDCHAFCNRGDKGAFPLWRDAAATEPNVTAGLLDLLTATYGRAVTAEDLAAYIVGVLATGAYTAKFADELGTSPARVPLTKDVGLFEEVVALGRDLIWWETFGERFAPLNDKGHQMVRLPSGTAKNTVAVGEYPEKFSYNEETQTIVVGDGEFAPVPREVWDFEVSGFDVVRSWLRYRMKKRSGRKSSELDDIRPDRWDYSEEFVRVLAIVEHLLASEDKAAVLIDRILESDLLLRDDLPVPTEEERDAPAASGHRSDGNTQLSLAE